MFHVPEEYRVINGAFASDASYGNNGHFKIRLSNRSVAMIIASDGKGWEHVSVHIATMQNGRQIGERTPTWAEMCRIKNAFWDAGDCVIQYHPPEDVYVNNHEHTLHLWRPTDQTIPVPPKIFVGI